MKNFALTCVVMIIILCMCCCLVSVFGWGVAKNPKFASLFLKQRELGVNVDTQKAKDIYTEVGFKDNLSSTTEVSGELDVVKIDTTTNTPVVKTSKPIKFTGTKKINRTFTSDEASSIGTLIGEEWDAMPFKNTQILIHEDGTVEVSTMLSVKKAEEFATQLGYSQDQINQAKSYISIFEGEIPIYMTGTGFVENNELVIDLDSLEVVGYIPPQDVIDGFESILIEIAKKSYDIVPGLDVQQLKVENGEIKFVGTIPGQVDYSEDDFGA